MAFKLSKDERASHSNLVSTLSLAADVLIKARTPENIAAYNALISECEAFRSEIADRLREEWDGKSEKWQDSEVGEDASAMVEAWEDFTLDEFDNDGQGEASLSEEEADMLHNLIDEFTNLQDAV